MKKSSRPEMLRGKRAMKDLVVRRTRDLQGGKQKPDGTAAGNVAAKWSLAQGAAA